MLVRLGHTLLAQIGGLWKSQEVPGGCQSGQGEVSKVELLFVPGKQQLVLLLDKPLCPELGLLPEQQKGREHCSSLAKALVMPSFGQGALASWIHPLITRQLQGLSCCSQKK